MHAGRKHETLVSEIKDLIAPRTVRKMSIILCQLQRFPNPKVVMQRSPGGYSAHWVCSEAEDIEFEKSTSFMAHLLFTLQGVLTLSVKIA